MERLWLSENRKEQKMGNKEQLNLFALCQKKLSNKNLIKARRKTCNRWSESRGGGEILRCWKKERKTEREKGGKVRQQLTGFSSFTVSCQMMIFQMFKEEKGGDTERKVKLNIYF